MSVGKAEHIAALGPWFYDFDLPGGVRTNPALSGELRSIHADRVVMLAEAIRIAYPNGLNGADTLDVGCHEGYFSHRLLELGAGSVVGVDVRERNLQKAGLVANAMGARGLSWVCADAEDLVAAVGTGTRFGLSLAYGLIYHCENPVRVLRQIASVTERAIVIESQLLDEPSCPPVEWGREGYRLPVRGTFAVLDESRLHPTNSETGASPLALCPSEMAIRTVLAHCGFGRVDRVFPPEGANEQLVRGKRGVFVALRDGSTP